MNAKKIVPHIVDDRGVISDILYNESINHVTVITSKKGASRGNHYHKQTTQWVYLQSGRLEVGCRRDHEETTIVVLEPGDLVCTAPLEQHVMLALEDSVFFVFTSGPRGGKDYENDTYRLEEQILVSKGVV